MKFFTLLALGLVTLMPFVSCKKEVPEPPQFTITASSRHIVAGQTITLSENSTNSTGTQWQLPGSTTPLQSGSSISVTYSTAGIFTITATVSNGTLQNTQLIDIIVEPSTWVAVFPGQQPNNNNTIGDFCCTGETFTVRNISNQPLGYAYFFRWQGQAFDLPEGAIAPNIQLDLSGCNNLDGTGNRAMGSVFFPAEACYIGAVRELQVGNLRYRAKILGITYPPGVYNATHYYMDSLRIELTVTYVV